MLHHLAWKVPWISSEPGHGPLLWQIPSQGLHSWGRSKKRIFCVNFYFKMLCSIEQRCIYPYVCGKNVDRENTSLSLYLNMNKTKIVPCHLLEKWSLVELSNHYIVRDDNLWSFLGNCRSLFLFFFFFKLRFHSPNPKFTLLKYTIQCYCVHEVVQPLPLCDSRMFSLPQKGISYPLAVIPSLLSPELRATVICFTSLWIYLFWTFHITGMIHYVAFCVWRLSLCIFSRFMHVAWTSFFFMTE